MAAEGSTDVNIVAVRAREDCTVYVIEYRGKLVERRYNEFKMLAADMTRYLDDSADDLPPFPVSRDIFSSKQQTEDRRRVYFELYLRALVGNVSFASSPLVQNFLRGDGTAAPPPPPANSLAVQQQQHRHQQQQQSPQQQPQQNQQQYSTGQPPAMSGDGGDGSVSVPQQRPPVMHSSSTKADANTLKSGWLRKKGDFGFWNRRWFVLDHRNLVYFKTAEMDRYLPLSPSLFALN